MKKNRKIVDCLKKRLAALQDDRLEKKEEAQRAHEGWTRVKDNRRFRLPDEQAFRPGGTWKPPRSAKRKKNEHNSESDHLRRFTRNRTNLKNLVSKEIYKKWNKQLVNLVITEVYNKQDHTHLGPIDKASPDNLDF